jgi:hypothetical protein
MGFFKTQGSKIQGFLDKLTNDAHVPIALFVFLVTSAYHFHTGKDLGTNYINSLYAFYGFLLGHAGVYQKWPDQSNSGGASAASTDQSQQTQTVDVTVQAPPAAPAPAPAAAPATGSNGPKG